MNKYNEVNDLFFSTDTQIGAGELFSIFSTYLGMQFFDQDFYDFCKSELEGYLEEEDEDEDSIVMSVEGAVCRDTDSDRIVVCLEEAEFPWVLPIEYYEKSNTTVSTNPEAYVSDVNDLVYIAMYDTYTKYSHIELGKVYLQESTGKYYYVISLFFDQEDAVVCLPDAVHSQNRMAISVPMSDLVGEGLPLDASEEEEDD